MADIGTPSEDGEVELLEQTTQGDASSLDDDASASGEEGLRPVPPPQVERGAERPLRISTVGGAARPATTRVEVTWPEFLGGFLPGSPEQQLRVGSCTVARGAGECAGSKCREKDGEAWCPARFEPQYRCVANSIAVALVVADIDQVDQGVFDLVVAAVRALGVAGLLYGTHNDRKTKEGAASSLRSARLVLRPDRDVRPEEHRAAVAGMLVKVGLPADMKSVMQCADTARLFYFLSRSADAPDPEVVVFEGASGSGGDISVDELVRLGVESGHAVARSIARVEAHDHVGQPLDAAAYRAMLTELLAMGPAIDGSGGGKKALGAGARVWWEWDATEEQGWKAIEEWNASNQPPWDLGNESALADLEGKAWRGYKRAAEAGTRARGCRRLDYQIPGIVRRALVRSAQEGRLHKFRGRVEDYVTNMSVASSSSSGSNSGSNSRSNSVYNDPNPPTASAITPEEVRLTSTVERDGIDGLPPVPPEGVGGGDAPVPRRKKEVLVGTNIELMADEGREMLADDDDEERRLYQHGGELVQVARARTKTGALAPRIRNASLVDVRARLSDQGRWFAMKAGRGNQPPTEEPCLPPKEVADRIVSSGSWRVPEVKKVSDRPFMRSDGTVVVVPGYDVATGVYYAPAAALAGIRVPSKLRRRDAERAYELLVKPFSEFKFTRLEHHQAAVVAAICSVVCRTAILGPVPFFGVDAPMPSAGKSLLVDAISVVACGVVAARMTARNEEDEPKRILPILLQGTDLALVDNVSRRIGGQHWDALGTSTLWGDRELGLSRMRTVEALCVWFFTGNNMQFEGDMLQRMLMLRIDPGRPDPERRKFSIKLRDYVAEHRAELIQAALTLVSAYILEGRPKVRDPHGKYPEWNASVRGGVEWACGVDPWSGAGSKNLPADQVDEDVGFRDPKTEADTSLAMAWYEAFRNKETNVVKEVTVKEVIACTHEELRAVLLNTCAREGRVDSHLLGARLKNVREKVLKLSKELYVRFVQGLLFHGDRKWRLEVVPRVED